MKQEQSVSTEGKKKQRRIFSAREKSQAVLALWSGRRNASGLMKEMKVAWGALNGWEKQALMGMLTALDPTWQQPEEREMRLPERVERLMEKTLKQAPEKEAPAAE